MSTLAVIAYPEQDTAAQAAAALVRMQKEYLIQLEDVAWVTKKPDGKLKLHQGTSLTGVAAAGGAFWGFLFGLIFLVPIAGMAIGAASGALVAHFADIGVDDKWASRLPPPSRPAVRRSSSWRATPRASVSFPKWPSSGARCSRRRCLQRSRLSLKRHCRRSLRRTAAADSGGKHVVPLWRQVATVGRRAVGTIVVEPETGPPSGTGR